MYLSTREPVTWLLLSALERLIAAAALLALGPFLLIIGAAIAVLSRTSPLIAHRRLGRGGDPLWVLKFRTMWQDGGAGEFGVIEYIVDEIGPRDKRNCDGRISSGFARFCRRHSIDELPQLIQVVRGEMSLVGPRPITAAEWKLHDRDEVAEILRVRPGLSGLWQTKGRSRLTYQERRDMDLKLVRNRSLKLYFQILLWTLPEIWNGRNAW